MSTAAKPAHVAAALAAVYLIWGSTYFAIKLALPDYPPFLLTGTRMAIAGGLMLAWLAWRRTPLPKRGQWRANPRSLSAPGDWNRADSDFKFPGEHWQAGSPRAAGRGPQGH